MSTEQRENLDAVLQQSPFPVGIDVSEQRRQLRELISAQPLPADVTVTAAALGGVPTAEITLDGTNLVMLFFTSTAACTYWGTPSSPLTWPRRSAGGRAKVISVDYRLAREVTSSSTTAGWLGATP